MLRSRLCSLQALLVDVPYEVGSATAAKCDRAPTELKSSSLFCLPWRNNIPGKPWSLTVS